jgi:hypothetical protein
MSMTSLRKKPWQNTGSQDEIDGARIEPFDRLTALSEVEGAS